MMSGEPYFDDELHRALLELSGLMLTPAANHAPR
jgi:hypothetical protein